MNGMLENAIVKVAQEILERRDLDRKERKQLFEDLPEARKKQVLKFIAEQINKNRKEKSYIVDTDYGEATYTPSSDKLERTALNVAADQKAFQKRQDMWNWGNAIGNVALMSTISNSF